MADELYELFKSSIIDYLEKHRKVPPSPPCSEDLREGIDPDVHASFKGEGDPRQFIMEAYNARRIGERNLDYTQIRELAIDCAVFLSGGIKYSSSDVRKRMLSL